MRKTFVSTLLVALLLGAAGLRPANAEAPKRWKPLAVASFAGYDKMKGNIDLAGEMAGMPDLGKGLEAMLNLLTGNQGLAGLDKARPWGAVVQINGDQLGGYAFLPVTDLEKLLKVAQPHVGKAKDLGDGVFQIDTKRKPVYVQQKGDWAFVCDKPEGLAHTPEDPSRLLGGLNTRYDLAMRINAANVPEKHRKKAIARMREEGEKNLHAMPGETEEEFAVRKRLSEKIFRSIVEAINDLDKITIGVSLDHEAKKAWLDVSATMLEGSRSAQRLADLDQTKTDFGGFRFPGAALSANVAGNFGCDTEDLNAVFKVIRERAAREIDAKELSEEETTAGKELVAGMLDVAQADIAGGRVDAGMALVLKPGAVTLMAGRHVADAKKLDDTLGKLVEAVRAKKPKFVAKVLKTDVAEFMDVHFHRVSIDIPQDAKDREKVVEQIGETLEVVVGIGEHSVYVAMGRDPMKALKRVIKRSEAMRDRNVPPVAISIAMSEVANFMAAVAPEHDRPKIAKAAAILEEAAGKDHLSLVVRPAKRGIVARIQIEEGILKLLASIRKRQ